LGDGAFGTVYKAVNVKTGEVVAIKKMKAKYSNWNECIELREIKSLRKLNHCNIIKLKEVLLVSDELYMAFEYLEYNLYEVYAKMKEHSKHFTEP
jgi:serine/threonine protein kinase